MGKHVEIAAFPANLSGDLVNVADNRQSLSPEFFSDLWSRKRGSSRAEPQGGRSPRRGWRLGRSRSKDSE